jgi:hypothetical protein
MHDTDRYVVDGRLDVEAIERDGHGRGAFCRSCEEVNPCGIAWAARRVKRMRTIRANSETPRT